MSCFTNVRFCLTNGESVGNRRFEWTFSVCISDPRRVCKVIEAVLRGPDFHFWGLPCAAVGVTL